jgi:hypothetical protein
MVAHSTSRCIYHFWTSGCILFIFCSQPLCLYAILIDMKLFFKKLQTKIFSGINILVSIIFYFFGIGLTKIIAIFFNKQFLEKSFSSSSWKKVGKNNLEKQY